MKIKSSKLILSILLPVFLFCLIGTVVILVISLIFGFDVALITLLVLASISTILCLVLTIFAVHKNSKEYLFDEDKIIYTNKGEANIISVSDIQEMLYSKSKWYYCLIFIFVILLGDGGGIMLPTLTIVDNDGKSLNLGYFNRTTIKKLSKIYPNLLKIK